MFPQNTWHMKMIEYNHFICHYYCHFPVYSHILLSSKTWCSGRSLMTSSDSSSKLISCSFPRSVPDLVNHQYDICRMYSEENPQDFRLLIPGLYSCERVMWLLSAEASFKRIPSLNALNERCSMNDMPSICILLTFAPNSTDLVSLPLTMGRT